MAECTGPGSPTRFSMSLLLQETPSEEELTKIAASVASAVARLLQVPVSSVRVRAVPRSGGNAGGQRRRLGTAVQFEVEVEEARSGPLALLASDQGHDLMGRELRKELSSQGISSSGLSVLVGPTTSSAEGSAAAKSDVAAAVAGSTGGSESASSAGVVVFIVATLVAVVLTLGTLLLYRSWFQRALKVLPDSGSIPDAEVSKLEKKVALEVKMDREPSKTERKGAAQVRQLGAQAQLKQLESPEKKGATHVSSLRQLTAEARLLVESPERQGSAQIMQLGAHEEHAEPSQLVPVQRQESTPLRQLAASNDAAELREPDRVAAPTVGEVAVNQVAVQPPKPQIQPGPDARQLVAREIFGDFATPERKHATSIQRPGARPTGGDLRAQGSMQTPVARPSIPRSPAHPRATSPVVPPPVPSPVSLPMDITESQTLAGGSQPLPGRRATPQVKQPGPNHMVGTPDRAMRARELMQAHAGRSSTPISPPDPRPSHPELPPRVPSPAKLIMEIPESQSPARKPRTSPSTPQNTAPRPSGSLPLEFHRASESRPSWSDQRDATARPSGESATGRRPQPRSGQGA